MVESKGMPNESPGALPTNTPVPPPPTPVPVIVVATPTPLPVAPPQPQPTALPPQPTAVLPAFTAAPQLTVIPPFNTDPNVPCNQSITHVVQEGERVFRIALRYNTTVQAIAADNALQDVNLIYPGQHLRITSCHRVETHHGYPNGWTQGAYIVRRGDTLFRIALNYGTSVHAIMAANGLTSDLIYPGQYLYLP